jgi:hypothetical protein
MDSQSITIQTLSLFDQRLEPGEGLRSWKGDWLFRRSRLDIVDQEVQNAKPDLLLLQDVLARKENSFDSDSDILSRGALEGYFWDLVPLGYYEDTDENFFQGVAASYTMKIAELPPEHRMIRLGTDGYLTVHKITWELEPLLLFDVKMPSAQEQAASWYEKLPAVIKEEMAREGGCAERVIVGGYMPYAQSPAFKQMQSTLGLKDSSAGFCEQEYQCFTSTPLNGLYAVAVSRDRQEQTDFILVPEPTEVMQSQIAYSGYKKTADYEQNYGLSGLWASIRFGWQTTVQMAKCQDRD